MIQKLIVPDAEMLKELFSKYNKEYFDGFLTPITTFRVEPMKKHFATFDYFLNAWNEVCDPIITVSNYYTFTEEQLRNILVHEMLHEYIASLGIEEKREHGKIWKKYAKQLNEEYGLCIKEVEDVNLHEKSGIRQKNFFKRLFDL